VADSAITVGAGVLILEMWVGRRRQSTRAVARS
jgi:lipoprotein signal peptidase